MQRRYLDLTALALLAAFAQSAQATDTWVRFSGAIGVDPVASLNPATTNIVRGINPGGRQWVLRKLTATVDADGSISAKGSGLLFGSGDLIGTRGAVTSVLATLACGAANSTATLFNSPAADLDLAGNFRIKGALTQDGVNAAVMPPSCENPALLIRSFNTTTGLAGNWFAAGIPADGDDD